jgi:hypothetical protein
MPDQAPVTEPRPWSFDWPWLGFDFRVLHGPDVNGVCWVLNVAVFIHVAGCHSQACAVCCESEGGDARGVA